MGSFIVRECGADELRCSDGVCVSKAWLCDNVNDCPDGSDELGCSKYTLVLSGSVRLCDLSNSACRENEFACGDTKCVPESLMCDGTFDCDDGSDEKSCRKFSYFSVFCSIPPSLSYDFVIMICLNSKSMCLIHVLVLALLFNQAFAWIMISFATMASVSRRRNSATGSVIARMARTNGAIKEVTYSLRS